MAQLRSDTANKDVAEHTTRRERALTDVVRACKIRDDDYVYDLNSDPPSIARRLREYANRSKE